MKTFQQWWEESTAHPLTDPDAPLPACYVSAYQAWKAAREPRDARIQELEAEIEALRRNTFPELEEARAMAEAKKKINDQ